MIKTFVLVHDEARRRAGEAVRLAPAGSVVTVGEAKATRSQNDKVHPLVREIAHYLIDKGAPKRTEEWWRHYLVAMYAGQEVVPNPDGSGGFTVMNRIGGTSEMTKAEKSSFIEWLFSFGVEIGMEWD